MSASAVERGIKPAFVDRVAELVGKIDTERRLARHSQDGPVETEVAGAEPAVEYNPRPASSLSHLGRAAMPKSEETL